MSTDSPTITSTLDTDTDRSRSERPSDIEAGLVQIQADNAEIQRRISAFMQKKRADIDEINRREFCNVTATEQDGDSCARTDAVFIPQFGGRSRVKVTRVVNQQGPQTVPQFDVSPKRPRLSLPSTGDCDIKPTEEVPPGVGERLFNMEKHLKISGNSVPSDVYCRIKALEERILHLESLSPEYFHHNGMGAALASVSRVKHQQKSHMSESNNNSADVKFQNLSCADLETRIESLKQSLLQRTLQPQSQEEPS